VDAGVEPIVVAKTLAIGDRDGRPEQLSDLPVATVEARAIAFKLELEVHATLRVRDRPRLRPAVAPPPTRSCSNTAANSDAAMLRPAPRSPISARDANP
jgi:hypothetical protein